MKIHVWAPAFTGFGGGIGAFSRELAFALRELGADITLVGKHDRSGRWPGFRLHGSGPVGGPFRTAQFAANCLAACALDRPDTIISTHVNFGPVAAVARRTFGTKFTMVAHGIDIHPALSPRTLDALREAHRIVAVSGWTGDRVLSLGGIDRERLSILPNTIDETRFTAGVRPDYLVDRHKLQKGERVILTVARLDPGERYKGYDRTIEALPLVRASSGPVRFIIVGSGDDKGRLTALARTRGVDDSVTFAGFVPADELADYYRLADVFAMPSTGEGFGIVFLEALCCGTPVVAGNRDGSVDAVDGGKLGLLVDPTSVQEIAGGLTSILSASGPSWWYDRDALSNATVTRFGRQAFRARLREILSA